MDEVKTIDKEEEMVDDNFGIVEDEIRYRNMFFFDINQFLDPKWQY